MFCVDHFLLSPSAAWELRSQSSVKVVSASFGSILGRPVTAGNQDKQHQKKPLWIHVTEVPQLQKNLLPNMPAESLGGLLPWAPFAGTGTTFAVRSGTHLDSTKANRTEVPECAKTAGFF